MTVQLVGAIQAEGLLDATLYHPDPIVGMAQFVNVMLVIIVQVKLLIKQHVNQEPLHQYKEPYPVLSVYQESMRRLLVRLSAMIVMMMNINRNQLQQTASKFKKVVIDQVQLQKFFVQLVKQEVVVVHCALNATKGRIKT